MAYSATAKTSITAAGVTTRTTASFSAAAGDCVIVAVTCRSSTPTFTVSDSVNGSYSASRTFYDATASLSASVFWFPNGAGSGSQTVTVNASSSANYEIWVFTASGLGASPTSVYSTNTTASLSGSTLNCANPAIDIADTNGAVLIAAMMCSSNAGWNAITSYTATGGTRGIAGYRVRTSNFTGEVATATGGASSTKNTGILVALYAGSAAAPVGVIGGGVSLSGIVGYQSSVLCRCADVRQFKAIREYDQINARLKERCGV